MRPPNYWRDRAALRLIRTLPDVLIAAPERAALAFAMILVGGVIVLRIVSRGDFTPTRALAAVWAVALLIGGVAVMGGILADRRPLERLGLWMTVLAGATVPLIGASAYMTLIFIAIGTSAALRLLVSSASRTITAGIRRGARAGEG